jgi:hypothetical protein
VYFYPIDWSLSHLEFYPLQVNLSPGILLLDSLPCDSIELVNRANEDNRCVSCVCEFALWFVCCVHRVHRVLRVHPLLPPQISWIREDQATPKGSTPITAHPELFPNCYAILSFLPLTALAHLSVVFLPRQESCETTAARPSGQLSPHPKTLPPSPSWDRLFIALSLLHHLLLFLAQYAARLLEFRPASPQTPPQISGDFGRVSLPRALLLLLAFFPRPGVPTDAFPLPVLAANRCNCPQPKVTDAASSSSRTSLLPLDAIDEADHTVELPSSCWTSSAPSSPEPRRSKFSSRPRRSTSPET